MSSVSTTNISGTDQGTDHDFGRPSGTGVFLYRYPGTSYLATITLSLRDKIHSSAEALLKFNAYGMRSRASGAACLDASFCCFCERALALSELRLFQLAPPVFTFAPSLDVRRRIARERVPTNALCLRMLKSGS